MKVINQCHFYLSFCLGWVGLGYYMGVGIVDYIGWEGGGGGSGLYGAGLSFRFLKGP